ncbi:MAG: hypothetical protein ACE5I5_18505 [Candidatus Heimdallarchaeota archaeon]
MISKQNGTAPSLDGHVLGQDKSGPAGDKNINGPGIGTKEVEKTMVTAFSQSPKPAKRRDADELISTNKSQHNHAKYQPGAATGKHTSKTTQGVINIRKHKNLLFL